jgi:parvulin-like peptidyl-prolyl isomerase
MLRNRIVAAAFLASVSLTACAGLKDALTAHVDFAARAGSQELSGTRLAQMIASSGIKPRKDIALAITNLWVNYQLLGQAGAKGDTLGDNKLGDAAMWAQIGQIKSQRFMEAVAKTYPKADSSGYEKRYNNGELLDARHILFKAMKSEKPAVRDSAKREAQRVLKMVNVGNFEAMAKKYSADGSAAQGGELGPFEKARMVPEFSNAVVALKPGEISGVIESEFGYHIIERETWADAKEKVTAEFSKSTTQKAESIYFDAMDKGQKLEVKPGTAKLVKALAEDIDSYRNDRTVVATARNGDLTAGQLAQWIAAFPPRANIRQQIGQAPDSVIPVFVHNVMRNELIMRAADSAKIVVDTTELGGIRNAFHSAVMSSMGSLRLSPAMLADSAKTPAEREKLAASRVEAYMDALLKNQAQFVDIAEPVAIALRKHFEARVVMAGVERAVADAEKLVAKADSIKKANQPSSVVPMPGDPTAAPAAKAPAKPDTGKPAAKPAAKKP